MGNVSLSRTVMEQIQTVLDEADDQYATLVMSNQWIQADMSAHVSGAVRDNCGRVYLSHNCTQPQDEAKIVRNRTARVAYNGGQGGHGGCRPYNGPGYSNGGDNSRGYQRGKFGPPKPNDISWTGIYHGHWEYNHVKIMVECVSLKLYYNVDIKGNTYK